MTRMWPRLRPAAPAPPSALQEALAAGPLCDAATMGALKPVRKRRPMRRSALIAIEAAVGIVATVALAIGFLCWRLAAGPIPLPILERHLEAELAGLRGGRPVTIERVELAWTQQALELKAYGVRPRDAAGATLSESRELTVALRPERLLVGRIALAQAAFEGGELGVTIAGDGSARVAFGPPGAAPDFIFPPPPPEETLVARVNRILDAAAEALAPLGAGADLRRLSVSGLTVRVEDERSGRAWRADDVALGLVRDRGVLRLDAAGGLAGSGASAPMRLGVVTDVDFGEAVVEVELADARVADLAPAGMAGVLTGLEAPLGLTASAVLDRRLGVTALEGEARVGRGVMRMPAGDVAPLDGGRVRGRYEFDTDTLVIQEAALAGSRTRVSGEGRLARASALFSGSGEAPAAFAVAFDRLILEMPGVFSEPVALNAVEARGALNPAAREVVIERFAFTAGAARGALSGRVYWADVNEGLGLGLQLDGGAEGPITKREVLGLWPLQAAPNTRDWLDRNLLRGVAHAAKFSIDAKPGELGVLPLRDDLLELTFRFQDGELRYLDEMRPVTEAAGNARLTGNRFEVAVETAAVGALSLSEGAVVIPRLNPVGVPARYSALAKGPANAMIALLYEAPIDFDETFPADPTSVTGQGAARFEIRRPFGPDVPAEALEFSVDARLEGVGARSRDGRFAISDWRLSVSGDDRAVRLAGPLRLDGAPLMLNWTQALRDAGPAPSRFEAEGTLDVAQLERLGFPVSPYARGPVGVDVRAQGVGLEVASAAVSLDLAAAEVDLIDGYYRKRAGAPLSLRFDAARGADGGYALTRIDARAPDARATGAARFDAEGGLVAAALDQIVLDDRTRIRLNARRDAQGRLQLAAAGQRIDLGHFLTPREPLSPPLPAAAEAPEPFSMRIETAEAGFRGAATLRDARIAFDLDGRNFTALDLVGQTAAGADASVQIGPDPSGKPKITVAAEDAGFAWEAITGQNTVRGGAVSGSGDWTPDGRALATMTLKIDGFEVVDMPVMARLLASVGSLRGMAELLNGDSISFTSLEAPVTFTTERLSIGETRLSGPSIGLTVSGAVDLQSGRLALDGVLVPSYGFNSMWGELPLLGGLLTSRKGEGVVGITFSMRGPSDDARVMVNPLSALAPGIFRRIFEPFQRSQPTPPPAAGAGG